MKNTKELICTWKYSRGSLDFDFHNKVDVWSPLLIFQPYSCKGESGNEKKKGLPRPWMGLDPFTETPPCFGDKKNQNP